MALRNTPTSFGSVSKKLHLIIALLVIAMLIFGVFLDDIPKAMKGIAYNTHKLTGLAVGSLMILFFLWSLINTKPSYPTQMKAWEKTLAHIVQALLYLLVIAMPITGWLMSTAAGKNPHVFGLELVMPGIELNKPLAKLAKEYHEILAYTLMLCIALHIAGALKHHFIDKNDVLKRMMGRS